MARTAPTPVPGAAAATATAALRAMDAGTPAAASRANAILFG